MTIVAVEKARRIGVEFINQVLKMIHASTANPIHIETFEKYCNENKIPYRRLKDGIIQILQTAKNK